MSYSYIPVGVDASVYSHIAQEVEEKVFFAGEVRIYQFMLFRILFFLIAFIKIAQHPEIVFDNSRKIYNLSIPRILFI